MTVPFSRTVCACATCQSCCKSQPGHVLPGEVERIAEYLGKPLPEVLSLFWASPGALVMDTSTGRQFRIGTITPRFDRRAKRCVFLGADDRCTVHEVAPFGCAYFDTHMSAAEGQRRSAWGLRLLHDDPTYIAQRKSLPFADSYKPKGY